jgi:hypothetical protein
MRRRYEASERISKYILEDVAEREIYTHAHCGVRRRTKGIADIWVWLDKILDNTGGISTSEGKRRKRLTVFNAGVNASSIC